MSKIWMNIDEINDIDQTLTDMIDTITQIGNQEFTKYFNHLFYENGRALELIQRILSSELYKALEQTDGFVDIGVFDIPLQDYSGKVQMLVTYYKFLLEYVKGAMIKFQDEDEAIKSKLLTWNETHPEEW
ncbi:MAG: hypothetical protein ACK5LC_10745 [Coprobacillaceae bacterium]